MLGTMATTAAGVVAGSFLFQGIQGLMNRNEPDAGAERTHSAQQSAPEEIAQAPESEYEDAGDSYAAGPDDSGGDFA